MISHVRLEISTHSRILTTGSFDVDGILDCFEAEADIVSGQFGECCHADPVGMTRLQRSVVIRFLRRIVISSVADDKCSVGIHVLLEEHTGT